MKQFYSYIRVSTAKQGEQGVSLAEQQEAIDRYATREGLEIIERLEERETAAKRGRPVFARMLKLLRHGKVDGVIIHKIDRSARNLKDWSDLGELIDAGMQVHFVNESLDLQSRGGRLSADIQAVIAADYIRNLREEIRKGFYGRLKQGLYPLPAPIGYVDQGSGKPKTPHAEKAPLVRQAFQLYATGRHTLQTLGDELFRLGLRNRNGGRVTETGLSQILNNPFYFGLIRLHRSKEMFPGIHAPLISKQLFDRTQAVLHGKTTVRTQRHDFVFRRLLTCTHCRLSLIGELQKGHVYYRCHTRGCPTSTVRHEIVERQLRMILGQLALDDAERDYARSRLSHLRQHDGELRAAEAQGLRLRGDAIQQRLARLTDAFIDGNIEKPLFEERKNALFGERREIEDRLREIEAGDHSVLNQLAENLELAGSAHLQYELAVHPEKRDLVQKLTSNRAVDGRNVEFTLRFPFDLLAKRYEVSNGAPFRNVPRTWDALIQTILNRSVVEESSPGRMHSIVTDFSSASSE